MLEQKIVELTNVIRALTVKLAETEGGPSLGTTQSHIDAEETETGPGPALGGPSLGTGAMAPIKKKKKSVKKKASRKGPMSLADLQAHMQPIVTNAGVFTGMIPARMREHWEVDGLSSLDESDRAAFLSDMQELNVEIQEKLNAGSEEPTAEFLV